MAMPSNMSSIAQPIFASQGANGQQVYIRPASIAQPQQAMQVQVHTNKPKEVRCAVGKAAPHIQGMYYHANAAPTLPLIRY